MIAVSFPAGFTPAEAIHIQTENGANFLGEGNRIGTIAPGKQADLVVIHGDPVKDISILENRGRFIAVLQGGIIKAGQLA